MASLKPFGMLKELQPLMESNFLRARQIKTEGWRAVRPKKQSLREGWNSLPSNPCDGSVESFEFKESNPNLKGV